MNLFNPPLLKKTINFKNIILMALSIGLSQNQMIAGGCETVEQSKSCIYPEQLSSLINTNESCGILKLKILPNFTEQLSNSFDNLIDDRYLKGDYKFRKRSYGTAKISNNIFTWDEGNVEFLQGTSINNYLGGISREYPPIDPSIKENLCQQVIMNAYNQLPSGDYDIGVHQMRTLANNEYQGIPTPEGIHQDGFDYVTITCINLKNVSGGITSLFDTADHSKILFEGMLQPGMQLVFSDRTLSHFTSNISPKIPGDTYRDVIVTTFLTRHK